MTNIATDTTANCVMDSVKTVEVVTGIYNACV